MLSLVIQRIDGVHAFRSNLEMRIEFGVLVNTGFRALGQKSMHGSFYGTKSLQLSDCVQTNMFVT